MEKLLIGLGVFLGGVALVSLIAVVLAWPVQLLWNGCLVDAVDGVHRIGFWQAMGLNFLFSILFKNTSRSNSNKNKK